MVLENIENIPPDHDYDIGEENLDEIEQNDETPARKRRRSKVRFDPEEHSTAAWNSKLFGSHFERLLATGQATKMVVCRIEACRAIFSETSARDMRLHLKHAHGRMIADVANFHEQLTIFSVATFQSFRLVNDPNFHSMLETFADLMQERDRMGQTNSARQVLPSDRTMAAKIDEAAAEGQRKLQTIGTTISAITADFTSKDTDYLAVTGHRINEKWKMESVILAFTPFEGPKTSAAVQMEIRHQLLALGIQDEDQEKLFATTYEGSNVLNIGGTNHINCMAHFGALLAKRSTAPYKNSQIDGHSKAIVHQIGAFLNELKQFVRNLKKNPKIRENANEALRPPVQTRWLSIFTMAREFVDGQECLRQSIQENSPEDETMLDMFLDEPALTAYLDVLDPINKMVVEMQADKRSTAGKVLPHIANIWRHLKMLEHGEDAKRAALAQCAMECFVKKVASFDVEPANLRSNFGKMNTKWIAVSAYLDPITFGQLESIYKISQGFSALQTMIPHLVSVELANLQRNGQQDVLIPGRHLFEMRRPRRTGATEMADYEQISIEELASIEDPLDFWKKNENRFPLLAELARRFLSAPASSAPSERAFKELRSVLGDFTRNRLEPTRTASLIFMRSQYLNKI